MSVETSSSDSIVVIIDPLVGKDISETVDAYEGLVPVSGVVEEESDALSRQIEVLEEAAKRALQDLVHTGTGPVRDAMTYIENRLSVRLSEISDSIACAMHDLKILEGELGILSSEKEILFNDYQTKEAKFNILKSAYDRIVSEIINKMAIYTDEDDRDVTTETMIELLSSSDIPAKKELVNLFKEQMQIAEALYDAKAKEYNKKHTDIDDCKSAISDLTKMYEEFISSTKKDQHEARSVQRRIAHGNRVLRFFGIAQPPIGRHASSRSVRAIQR